MSLTYQTAARPAFFATTSGSKPLPSHGIEGIFRFTSPRGGQTVFPLSFPRIDPGPARHNVNQRSTRPRCGDTMADIICIIGNKGGTGKTTLSHMLCQGMGLLG